MKWLVRTHWMLIGGCLALFGCRHYQGILGVDQCAEIPNGAVPRPVGTSLAAWQQTQVAAAFPDQGVFYQADFVGTTDQLGPAAEKHVARLVQQGVIGKVPIVVEPSGDSARDAARALSLGRAFAQAGLDLPAEQIQIAYPPAIGLDSFRAQQVARTASRGTNRGGGNATGAMGGRGGAGLGGGGGGGGGGGVGGIF